VRDVGDQIDIRHGVENADGVPTAATVTVTVMKPDGTLVSPTPTPTTTSTGIYDASFVATAAGVWRWTWTVTGAVVDVATGSVDVGDPVPPTYATLTELKKARRITDTADDVALQAALTRASRAIESKTGRRFWLDVSAAARVFKPYGREVDGKLLVDDIGTATGLIVEVGSGTSWTAVTDYDTSPDNALAKQRPITGLQRTSGCWVYGTDRVRVTAKWGWPSVPDDISQATLLLANRLYMRKDSPEGIAASGDWGALRMSRWDADVEALVGPFVLPGIG
jgi:hypothetical protein